MKLKHIISSTALALVSNASAASLIINGDFETGLTHSHNYGIGTELGDVNYARDGAAGPTHGATLPDNWTRGANETRGWAVTDIGETLDVISGSFAIRLDGANAGNPNGVHERLIQTGISMVSGQEYEFSLEQFGENSSTGQTLLIELIGTSGGAIGNDISFILTDTVAGAVETHTKLFTALGSGDYTLEVSKGSAGQHVIVDNITLNAVPEPSSTSLLGLGGLALILRRRK